MSGHRRLKQFAGAGQALDVVGIGVSGDDHLACRQVEIHAANELDDFIDGVKIADIDKHPFAAAVDQVDIDPQTATGLVVHLDDMGK